MMENNKLYIEKLKRKRMNTRAKIREYTNLGRNTDDLKINYQKILDELTRLGVNVSTKTSTVYLGDSTDSVIPKISYNIKQIDSVKESQENRKEKYNLNISWTNSINMRIISILKMYLEKYCKFISEDYNDMISHKEYTLIYQYEGTEELFNQFKSYISTTLDILNINDKYDIGVFGKKVIV